MAKKKTAMDYFVLPKSNNAAVYAIVNWEDFCCYVGSSQNVRGRASGHKSALLKGEHLCKLLQNAKDENKILRFLVLCEFENRISRDNLIMAEYCFMLEMLNKGFKLYNTNPKSKYSSQRESIMHHIIWRTVSNFGTERKIENALKSEYGINSGYMSNTKYREFEAKKKLKLI